MNHPFSYKRLLLATLIAASTVAATGFSTPSPRDRASALLNEQVEVLGKLYAEGASTEELHAVVNAFDRRAEGLLADLDDDERADLEAEIEAKVAGQLWGMN